MSSSSSSTLFPFQKKKLERAEERARRILDVNKLASLLDKTSTSTTSLEGTGIFFVDANYNIVLLRKFKSHCRKNPAYLVLKEPETPKTELTYATELKVRERESKLLLEASAAALSCGAAALSWIVVVGSVASVPISGGTSAGITYLTGAAAIATTGQCVNGTVRTAMEAGSPESLDALDSEDWYRHTSQAMDVLSLAGAAVAVGATIKSVSVLRSSTGKSYREVLSGLNRQERKKLTEEIVRANHPGVSNRILKEMIRKGAYPKRYSQPEISQSLRLRIKDSVSSSLSFSGSFVSGSMRSLAVGLYESVDTD